MLIVKRYQKEKKKPLIKQLKPFENVIIKAFFQFFEVGGLLIIHLKNEPHLDKG